jgi:peptidoglycan/LPS O-acetylase OafA/YrhL
VVNIAPTPDPGMSHFAGLDQLRGIAAISVMWMHMRGIFSPGGALVNAGLAVDLFFMLSGFVIAYAYREKLEQGMGWSGFIAYRVIRLYPMLLLGTLLGFTVFMLKQALHAPLPPEEHAINLVPTLFMIPIGLFYSAHDYPFDGPSLFPFNGPVWSLFYEFIVYGLYATSLRKMRPVAVWVSLIITSVMLVAAARWAGAVTELGHHGLIGFLGGFPRSIAAFMIGAIIYSTGIYRRFPELPFLIPSLAVVIMLNVPFDEPWYVQVGIVFVTFPLIIALAARSSLGEVTSQLANVLGRLSYPVYLLHVPLAIGCGFALKTILPGITGYGLATACAVITLVGAWVTLILYDEPLRRYLARKAKTVPRATPSVSMAP